MKKLLALLLTLSLLAGLMAACSTKKTPTEDPGTTVQTEPAVSEPTEPVSGGEIVLNDPSLLAASPTADNYRVFYEIFVGSFSDSNGDGIGDLRGIINRMDYLNDGDDNSGKSLGIEGIWLTPIFDSNSYHKYDINDYYTVDPDFGTMEDLKELIDLCHERNVLVILDLPLNHTGRLNQWFLNFVAAHQRGDTEDPFYDFYCYYTKGDTPPAGRTFAAISGTDDYYECNFDSGMPELNFDNEEVREKVLEVAAFYLDLGVDGFRFDAAKYVYFGDNPSSVEFWVWYMDQLRQIKPDIYTVAEVWDGDGVTDMYYPALNCFNFTMSQSSGLIAVTAQKGDVNRYTGYVENYLNTIRPLNENAMILPFIANHDNDRAAGYLPAMNGYAQMAANLLILGPGSPFIYYGEEIGMRGSRGSSNTDANRRLAMYWGDGDTVKDPDGATYSSDERASATVMDQLGQDYSLYNYYKRLIMIRKANPEIARGEYHALSLADTKVGGFVSILDGRAVCVLHNTTGNAVTLDLTELELSDFTILSAYVGMGAAALDGTTLAIEAQTSVVLRSTVENYVSTDPSAEQDELPLVGLSWAAIGSICGTTWDQDFPMEQVSDGIYECTLELHAGEELKVRADQSWDVNFGGDGLRDGENLKVTKDGTYVLRLTIHREDSADLVLVSTQEPSAWSVIGSILNTTWDTDFPMYETEPGVYESDGMHLYAGEELKVRKDGSWDVNFGSDGSRDGPNAVVPADGDYIIRLTVEADEQSATLELVGP